MLILKVIFAAFFLLIGGCTGTSPKKTEVVSEEVVKEKEITVSDADEIETAIDEDVLYLLLTAEIAGQRGQYDVAMEGYLRAANRVDDARIAERAAKIALYLKDRQKAEEAVSLWLQQDPENITARKVAVLSAFRENDDDAAIEHLNYLLEADPAGFEDTLLELAKVLESEGKGSFFYDVLDEMAGQHTDEASIPFTQALLAMQMGQNDVALDKAKAALDIQPDWGKALLLQAQLAAQSGDLERAREIIEVAVSKDPENDRLKTLLASVLLKSGEPEKAVEVYQEILKRNPEDHEAQYALALVYLQLKQEDKAKGLFLELVDVPSWQSQASLYLGRIEAVKGNADNALIWFDKITTGPLVMDANLASVSVLIEEKRYDEALERINSLKDRYPGQQIRFLLLEAEVYNEQKQYSKSFDLLTEALAEMPGQSELLYTRALVAERMDRLDILESDLKLILEKNPDDANALNALGYTLADRTDRLAEAEQYLQKAIELQPEESVIVDSYGWLLFRQGNPEQALEYLQRAYSEAKEGEIASHLVEVLWVLGRKDEAHEIFVQAMSEVSDKEPLIKLQQRIPGLK